MNKILLDSDVIINILKKREETVKKLLSFENYELFISPIVVAEIYAGARAKEIKQIEELFSYTAKYYNLKLWTYNKKHYPMKDIIFI